MTSRSTTTTLVIGSLLLFSVLSAATVLLAFFAPDSQNLMVMLISVPGAFLVESFHLASLYVALVFAIGAVLLLADNLRLRSLALLLASVLPFFTFATGLRLAINAQVEASPLTAYLADTVGRSGGASIALLLSAVESFLVVYLWIRGREQLSTGTLVTLDEQSESSPGDPVSRVRTIGRLLARTRIDGDATPETLTDLPDPAADSDGKSDRTEGAPEADDESASDPDERSITYRDDAFFEDEPAVVRAERRGRTFVDPIDDNEADEPDDPDEWVEEEERLEEVDDGDSEVADASRAAPRPRRRGRYSVPVAGLLQAYEDEQFWEVDDTTRKAADVLRVTLEEFGIQAEVTGIRKGPVITMFEILPAPGVKLSKIVNLSDNIAMRLASSSVRIVAPIPGKHAVGIEIPNPERAIVGFGDLLQEKEFQAPRMEIPIALGKDIPGDAQIVDLTRMPHVLIAGATGSGKSVCVNSIICSILYRRAPSEVKMILIDPKIVELKFYNDIPHLLTPVVTDPKKAFQALQYCIFEMERRYTLLDSLQVRDVQHYNRKVKDRKLATETLPYIVVVVDEFADLMATSGKELESTLARLAAMSRAVGIHLVLATQRPSTDVITGLIKANIPSRIAFMVASKIDSRIILDTMGAEKLLGRGDMLFTSAWDPFPTRLQGAFLSEEEVERVVEYVKTLGKPDYIDDEIFVEDDDPEFGQGELEDPLMEKAIDIVVTARKASASYLQRRLKIGYNRAARMVEEMERLGIVGPQQGSKPRDIIGAPDR